MATIRDATEGDLDGLAEALCRQPLLVRYGATAAATARSLRAALTRGDGLLVAERDGVAFGLAWFVPGGTFALGGYLRLLGLAPGHERQGAGAALLDEVERRTAVQSNILFALCDSQNQAARRFYGRRGYLEAGQFNGLVRRGIDEVVLWKRVAD
jgi:GNAT superfamily N-acetyltransferase